MTPPIGKTASGATVWRATGLVPGLIPERRPGLQHLTWQGPGDAVHVHSNGFVRDGSEHVGLATRNTISGPCKDETEAQHAVDTYISPPLDGILPSPGINAAAAAEIRHAARSAYRHSRHSHHGEAWDQWAARRAAQEMTARIAADSDPAVGAALDAFLKALASWRSLDRDGKARVSDAPEEEAALRAGEDAEEAHRQYAGIRAAAFRRHYAQISQAWREADTDFLRSHGAEMKAALPGPFRKILASLAEDPATPPAAGITAVHHSTGAMPGLKNGKPAASPAEGTTQRKAARPQAGQPTSGQSRGRNP